MTDVDSRKKKLKSVNHGALHKRRWRKKRSGVFLSALAFTGIIWSVFGESSDKEIVVTSAAAENVASADIDAEINTDDIKNTISGDGRGGGDDTIVYVVKDGDIPAEIFSQQAGYDANDTAALLAAAKEIYDFTSVRVGKDLFFTFLPGDQRAAEVRYEPTDAHVIIASRDGNRFTVVQEEIEYDTTPEVIEVDIESSLYVDALKANISEATVIGVGEVFSYSIDFASEIQKGDKLKVLYEKRTRKGKAASDGRVLAAIFTASGKDFYAYYFDQDDGDSTGYYDEEARVLERQFLKAPVDFYRITSGYTGRRLHPITNKYMAHYQIDYAAPTGTPTFSTARGTVTSAGFETGWGNIVRVKHAGGYSTHYAHLSGYAKGVAPGTKVDQGEVIGFVGSTGWSTGPHVDYGMRLNGNPVNPLKIELPKGAPIKQGKKVDFEQVKDRYDSLLNGNKS